MANPSSASSTASGSPSTGVAQGAFASPASLVLPAGAAGSAPITIAVTLTSPKQAPEPLRDNGAVVVALFALVGVLITVGAAHWRMRRELRQAAEQASIEREQTRTQAQLDREHAALESHKERIATTRRQVYLEAVEALGKAQMFLAGLAKEDLANLDYQGGMGALTIAVNRVAVVGEMDTVQKARELTHTMNRRFLKGMMRLVPLAAHKSSIAVHHAELEAAQVEIKRLLAAMNNHNETQRNDPAGFAALTRAFEIQQKRAALAAGAEQKAHTASTKCKQDYAAYVIEGSRELALFLDELAACVRRELSLETDFVAFRSQTMQMLDNLEAAFKEMKADVEAFQKRAASNDSSGTTG